MKRPRVSDTLSLQASYHRLGTVKYLHHWEEVPFVSKMEIITFNLDSKLKSQFLVSNLFFASATVNLAKLNPTSSK
jgi:hypothetical protein